MVADDGAPPPSGAGGDAEERGRLFVEAFAEGWRAPADADALADHFEPWLRPDYRFAQPFWRAVRVGPVEFREAFARPIFGVLSEVRGTVETLACRGDTVFISLRLDVTIGRHRATVRVCDQVTLVDGRAAERFTYADVTPLLPAIVRTPRSWWRLLRWQLDDLRAARRQRG
jgi:hypothetical protein